MLWVHRLPGPPVIKKYGSWDLGYEMPCGPVDGMDPVAVAEGLDKAIKHAREGKGPSFLEMKTYRYTEDIPCLMLKNIEPRKRLKNIEKLIRLRRSKRLS